MKTYAETQGKAPFDWNAFLAKESYTQRELENAIELSEHWVTCACGNLCNIIPRNQEGIPLDHMLRVEGDNFTYFLRNMRYGGEAKQHAISTLHAIESRSQEIINDLKNKKMKTYDELFAEHLDFTTSKFTKATYSGALRHAERELKEITEAIDNSESNERVAEEFGDLIGCIIDAAKRAGVYHMVKDCFEAKIIINKGREWRDNGDGSYSHIKIQS